MINQKHRDPDRFGQGPWATQDMFRDDDHGPTLEDCLAPHLEKINLQGLFGFWRGDLHSGGPFKKEFRP